MSTQMIVLACIYAAGVFVLWPHHFKRVEGEACLAVLWPLAAVAMLLAVLAGWAIGFLALARQQIGASNE